MSEQTAQKNESDNQSLSIEQIKSIVESLLFASDAPLTIKQLHKNIGNCEIDMIREAVAVLEKDYAERGVVLFRISGGYQFRTNLQNASWVQRLVAQRPPYITKAQLELLAIIAYRQPITRPEIEHIRGVDCGSPLRVVLERGLVRTLGKREEPGRPMLYGTSKGFLEFFNLNSLRDLPTLHEFQELSEENLELVDHLDQSTKPTEESSEASLEESSEASTNNLDSE